MSYQYHIFICEHSRPEGHHRGCCNSKGSQKIQAYLKKMVAEHDLKGSVRANKSGCLDTCENGPSVVIYPENIWYTIKNEEDAKLVFNSHILNGQPVNHLRQDLKQLKE